MFGNQKPMISYYGGKQRLASKIIPYIPKHTVYVEPFCGGATIFFKKPWPDVSNSVHYCEVINDHSELLINMYRVFQTRFDEIEHLLKNTLFSESEHKKANSILKGDIEADNLWKAWAYYVSSQQSFAHVLMSGWRRGVFARNEPFSWSSKLIELNNYRERLSHVSIANQDALKVIKQFDSPQTLFYCDPPYPNTEQGHYKGYSQKDFDNLINTLKSCKGSAIVSCYNQECPEGWQKIELKSYCSSSRKGKVGADRSKKASKEELGNRERTEVLLIKKAEEPREEIKKLYASGKYDCFEGDKIWQDLGIENVS